MNLKKLFIPFLIIKLFSLAVLAQDKLVVQPSQLLNNLHCTNFEWMSVKDISDKAAIKVPIILSGKQYWFQLDTGAHVTILYGDEASKRGWIEKGRESIRVPDIELSGIKIPAWRFDVMTKRAPGETAGTIGFDIFLGHSVILDYPRKRFCLVPQPDMPPEILRRIQWTNAEIRNGKFFVKPKINGKELNAVFFDTGASIFPLSVDFETWKTLTGLTNETQATSRLSVSSWGKKIPLYGAPALGALEIGSIRLEKPMVYYNAEQPDFFMKNWGKSTIGLMGNAPFWNEIVVLDFGTYPALGILR